MAIDVDGPFTRAGRAVYIAEAVRTPIGKSHPERGWFRDVHPNAMLAACYTDLITRAGIDPAARPADEMECAPRRPAPWACASAPCR